MRLSLLSLALLAACQTGSVKVGQTRPRVEDTGAGGADSGAEADGDDTGAPDDTDGSDTGTGADSADSGDSADSADSAEPEPTADYSRWEGGRVFTLDTSWWSCEDETAESAGPVGDASLASGMADACPSCEQLYEVSVSPDTICDYIGLSDPAYRGVVLGDTWAAVYSFSEDSDGDVSVDLLDSHADFDGWTLTYAYTIDFYGQDLEVEGTMRFSEATP